MLKISCDKCGVNLPLPSTMQLNELQCPACRASQHIIVLQAASRNPKRGKAAENAIADEATCFNHPNKKAQIVCDGCGAYLCNLCDISLESSHLCPKCFQQHQHNITTFQQEAVLYDTIALSLVLLPSLFFILWPILPLISIAAIIYVIIYSKRMSTPYRRREWRFWLAIIIATAELTGFAMFIFIRTG